jgi:hypothetical protein
MSDSPQFQLILYRTPDGQTRIQCRFENENVWLTQALMAELFQTTPQNITLLLRAIYAEGELQESATCRECLQVRSEGGRRIQRSLRHYSLDHLKSIYSEGALPAEATIRKFRIVRSEETRQVTRKIEHHSLKTERKRGGKK